MDYQIMTVNDLLSGLMDNVSQSQLDAEIKNFKFYAKKLGVRDYDSLYVAAVEDDPSYVLQDELMIPSPNHDRELYLYPSAKILTEIVDGNIYVYATTEDDLKQLFKTMDEFLNEDNLEVDFTPDDYKMETEETNKSLIDIEECLRLRDNRSNNKYQLQTKYLSERFTLDQKARLAQMLREDVSDEEIHNYMQDLYNDEEAMKSFYGVDSMIARDPYSAAQEDAMNDIEKESPLSFDPDDEEAILQHLMEEEKWSLDQAKEYFAHYWEVYENYLKDEYSVDDDFDWDIQD